MVNVEKQIPKIMDLTFKNTGRYLPVDNEKFKTVQQGVTATLVAALDPRVESQSGSYMADAQIESPYGYVLDKENVDGLWKMSEESVGQKFNI